MPGDTLWSVFENAVRRFGNRIAVEMVGAAGVDGFTYRRLYAMALAQAALLDSRVEPGDRCAILADNGADWCAAYLGILAAGAVAVPLDTSYRAAQVASILADSGAKVLFVNRRLERVARDAAAQLVAPLALLPLGGDEADSRLPAPDPRPRPNPSSPAVILYTSGTTADPKGVVLSHANLLAERDAAFACIDVSEQDAVLGVLPLFHALALLANLLLPLSIGARVVFLETVNSTELLRAFREREISIFACVPQFFYLIHQRVLGEVRKRGLAARAAVAAAREVSFALRRAGLNVGPFAFRRVHRQFGTRMRLWVTGGSKFDPAVGRDLYAMGFNILQAYGLTETSGAATVTTPDDAWFDTVGRPLKGIEVAIWREQGPAGQPAAGQPPAGSRDSGVGADGDAPGDRSAAPEGEIAIRGPIVMQGYFNRLEATAAVMRDGWLLTGDLGRLDARGRLTITGRKKDVIVLASGKNIYPEEVEAQYLRSPYVREICVMGLAEPGAPAAERLHAVVVPNLDLLRERKMVNAGDILRFEMEGLAVDLPPHKRVLGYDVWFDPLPRTTTGKIRRHEVAARLEEARRRRSAPEGAVLAPADRAWMDDPHVARALALIRARARGAARVHPDANLELDLGLDSMERVELLTELEQRCAVRVPQETAHRLFTVRQLVEAVRPGRNADRVDAWEPAPAARKPDLVSAASNADASWSALLGDLPPDTDPALGSLLKPRPIATTLLFLASRLLRLALPGRLRVSGLDALPERGPYIISPNHQSYLDPFYVCSVLPRRAFRQLFFVGAVEYFETPFMQRLARVVNCVPVDPDSNLVPAMKASAFGLSRGKVLVLFPEGERSIDGTVKRFKKGAAILSRHLGAPIVPVALKGVFEIWPRNRRFNWRAWLPGANTVRIEFGTPLHVGPDEDYGDAARRLREVVERMWQGL